MVAHTFNPITREAEAGGSLGFEASLVHRVCSRTARSYTEKPYFGEKKTPLLPRKRKERKENCPFLCQAVGAKPMSEENPISF